MMSFGWSSNHTMPIRFKDQVPRLERSVTHLSKTPAPVSSTPLPWQANMVSRPPRASPSLRRAARLPSISSSTVSKETRPLRLARTNGTSPKTEAQPCTSPTVLTKLPNASVVWPSPKIKSRPFSREDSTSFRRLLLDPLKSKSEVTATWIDSRNQQKASDDTINILIYVSGIWAASCSSWSKTPKWFLRWN